VYVALNLLIRETGQTAYTSPAPGHGGPALVANAYLENPYSEVYPHVGEDLPGLTTHIERGKQLGRLRHLRAEQLRSVSKIRCCCRRRCATY